jgi:hypothetical protein
VRKRLLATTLALLASSTAAFADSGNWDNQPLGNTLLVGPNFTPIEPTPVTGLEQIRGPVNLNAYVNSIPQGSSGPFPLFVSVEGIFLDPAYGGALNYFTAQVPLTNFATASSVNALQTQSNIFAVDLHTLAVELHKQARNSDQGVAMAFAASGVADLQSDEHFAISENWGTFNGQNAIAFGAAYRVADHISVSGSFAKAVNGPVAGRAGFRIGW